METVMFCAASFIAGMIACACILSWQSDHGGWTGSDGKIYKIVRVLER